MEFPDSMTQSQRQYFLPLCVLLLLTSSVDIPVWFAAISGFCSEAAIFCLGLINFSNETLPVV